MIESPQNPPQASPLKKALGVIVLVVIICLLIRAGSKVEPQGDKGSAMPAESVSSLIWRARDLGDLTLDAPYGILPGADRIAQLPAEAREVVESYEVFESELANPHLKVSRIRYKPGVELSLENAMDGAVRAVAAATGDVNPQINSTLVSIDGLPTCRADYSGSAKGKALHVDAAFVQRGQEMWQAQVISIGDFSAADTKRILDSIHLHAETR